MRWNARVVAYWMSQTDQFPPYSFEADAPRGGATSYALSAGAGLTVSAVAIAGIVALFLVPPSTEETSVTYEDLLSSQRSATLEVSGMQIRLVGATDPYDFSDGLFRPEPGNRFVSFDIEVRNNTGGEYASVGEHDFRLKDSSGDGHDPTVVSLAGFEPPRRLRQGQVVPVTAVFDIPDSSQPMELTYSPAFGGSFAFGERARFKFTR
jgi:hypothetical protein